MSETAGIAMLVAVAALLIATGLPAWQVLLGVAMAFAGGGMIAGVFALPLLPAFWGCSNRTYCRLCHFMC